MKLTLKKIEDIEGPQGQKDKLVFDDEQRGLALRVMRAAKKGELSNKSYLAQYTFAGRKRRIPLGSAAGLSLDAARKATAAILGEVAQGRDPAEMRKEAARRAREKAETEALTLEALISQWASRHLSERRDAYRAEATRAIRFAFGKHLSKPAAELTAKTVKAILNAISDKGKKATARLTLAYGRAAYGWAISKDLLTENPFEGIKLATVQARDRVLTDDELRAIWQATEGPGVFYAIVRALILTGQRREEVAAMRWGEIDAGRRAWIIPAARAKNGIEHIVPLSEQMRAHLDERGVKPKPERGKDGAAEPAPHDLVFPGRGTVFDGFSKAKAALDKASGVKDWRLHDLRRTLATGLQRLGVRLEVTEAVLNHVSGSRAGIVGIYQRHDYAADKQAALDAWGAHTSALLLQKEPMSNVTPLRARTA